jgi:CRP/FNR family cyclic AMP-dependent transcriptional regulator
MWKRFAAVEEDLMVSNGTGGARPRWPAGTLMSRLEPRAADDLLRLAVGNVYGAGAVLARQGAVGTHVYLLESASRGTAACVKVTATSANGIETLLGIRAAGDIVGEIAVLGQRPRSATVTVCSPLIGHPIPGDSFRSFLARWPHAWHAVSLMIVDRLEWANHRRLDFAGHDVTVHIARVIVDILDLYGRRASNTGELGVSLSQPELGSLVGASKEAAAKAVRRLREMGLIETGYRTIVIRDVAGLRAAAELAGDPERSLPSTTMSFLWLQLFPGTHVTVDAQEHP